MTQPMLPMLRDDDRGRRQGSFLPRNLRGLPPRGGWLRSVQVLAALALAAFGVVVTASAATGCSTTPKFCDGGYVRTVKGIPTCEGLCAPSKCANPGNVCVSNLCALECKSHADCALGEDCLAATPDGASAATKTCQANGRAPVGVKCPSGNECGGQAQACPDGSDCDFNQCGGGTCALDLVACGASATCSIGKCDDGTRCTVPGCTQDKCKPLVCLSAGVGDADAYCTALDCHADTNCPGGYQCAKVRDPHKICGAPTPKLAGLCGTTTDPCVMAGATDGTTFVQGPWCTERSECRVRKLCDPCTTDDDCGAIRGMHCTAMGAAKFCTTDCAADSDCGDGFKCASGACTPRAGSCTGKKTFCEPCHNDDDCEAASTAPASRPAWSASASPPSAPCPA